MVRLGTLPPDPTAPCPQPSAGHDHTFISITDPTATGQRTFIARRSGHRQGGRSVCSQLERGLAPNVCPCPPVPCLSKYNLFLELPLSLLRRTFLSPYGALQHGALVIFPLCRIWGPAPPGGVTLWLLEEGLISSIKLQAPLSTRYEFTKHLPLISHEIHPLPASYSLSSLKHSLLHCTPVPCSNILHGSLLP